MIRLADWDVQLTEYLRLCSWRAWCWGVHDCMMFCAGAVYVVTGEDLGTAYRGRYTTRRQATRLLLELGGHEEAVLDARFTATTPAWARRGDLAIVKTAQGLAAGVVIGERIALAARPRGLAYEPLSAARTVYRVG